MHAYLINRVGAGASSQKWCDSNNCECRWRRLWASAMFGFQKAARDTWWKVLWPLLSGFVWKWYVWWRKGTSPTPLLSHSETPPHFVIAHWLYVPQQLCRCLRSSFLSSISFCLSLSSSSLVVSLDPSPFSPYTTTTTSIVEFRQAIYIFLPGCFTSHSLNKVFFIVFAFLGARESERTHVCL